MMCLLLPKGLSTSNLYLNNAVWLLSGRSHWEPFSSCMIWITSETRKCVAGVSCITTEVHYTSVQFSAEVKLGTCKSGDTTSNDGMVNKLLSDLAYSLTKKSCQTGALLFPSSQALTQCGTKTRTGFQVVWFHCLPRAAAGCGTGQHAAMAPQGSAIESHPT